MEEMNLEEFLLQQSEIRNLKPIELKIYEMLLAEKELENHIDIDDEVYVDPTEEYDDFINCSPKTVMLTKTNERNRRI